MAIFGELDTEKASDTLEALDPKVQRDLIASLDKTKAAHLINEMTPGQAADLLAVLPWWDVQALVELLADKEKAAKVTAILEKQDEKVIDFSISGFLRFAPDKTVAETRAEFAQAAKSKAEITYIYVIDQRDSLLGVVDSKALLLAEESARLREIMNTKIVTLSPQSTLRKASELFARYLFRALPVTDDDGKILGVLPYRDVVALRHRYVE
jgi:Mg/Co/Ni transporter MgtE